MADKKIKLSEKTAECFEYIKGQGGRVSTEQIKNALGCEKIASVTGRVNSLVKNGLAEREKVDEGGEKPVTYVQLTEAGMNFVQEDDED